MRSEKHQARSSVHWELGQEDGQGSGVRKAASDFGEENRTINSDRLTKTHLEMDQEENKVVDAGEMGGEEFDARNLN